MKKIVCLLLLICLMLPAVASAEEHEYIGRMMVVNCKREVSMRAEPTQNSERLMWVSYHTVLENCWSGYGDYYYVELDGISGYIHEDYLEVYDGPEEIYGGEFYEEMQIVGCPGWTPLREMADVNAKELAKIPNGAVVTHCVYYADDFTYVEYNGLEGYVLTEYITLGTENVAEPDLSVKYVTNCEVEVSLRAEPTSSSKRLAWVQKNTTIEALGAENGYFLVCYDGEYGYIFGDYLANIEYIGEYLGEMTVSEEAIMYNLPDSDFGVLMTIPEGAVVDNCYTAHNGYYYVCYNDVYGYVFGTAFNAYGDGLEGDWEEPVYYGDMEVVNCDKYVSMFEYPDTDSERLLKVSLGSVVEDCVVYDDEFIYGEFDMTYGYILSDYLEPCEGVKSFDSLQVINCDEYVSLFVQPDTDSNRLVKVPLGEWVTNCVVHDDQFTYAEYDGRCGFILTKYLDFGEETGWEDDITGYMQVINCDSWVSFREQPTSASRRLAKVPKDTIVEVLGESDGYFSVIYNGMEGYIYGEYLDWIEGPYSDADDILSNTRTLLNSEGVGFGVYLISDSMGGDWSIIQEMNHLQNVLRWMPEEWWPLTTTLPEEQIIEIIGGNHLFLIIPSDEYASVTVNRLKLGNDGFTGIADEVLYESETGEPFLLRCNEYDFAMDSEILIFETDGDEYGWYPDVLPDGRIFNPQVEGAAYLDLTVYEGE